MGSDSKIGWTHATFNPVRGCRYADLNGAPSPACTSCYAEGMGARNPAVLGEWGPTGRRVFASEAYWGQPLKWNADAEKEGQRRRVFCASLADIFEGADVGGVESRIDVRPDYLPMLDRLFDLIVRTPHLDWLLLTKRPHLMAAWWKADQEAAKVLGREAWWPANAWAGTTVENQAAADERIPHLLRVPAAVRFLSVEPMLRAVDLSGYVEENLVRRAAGRLRRGLCPLSGSAERARVSWVIAGCESSGPRLGARPTNLAWLRSLRDQCSAAGVPFFLKQADVGGRLVHAPELDGRTWQEVPNA